MPARHVTIPSVKKELKALVVDDDPQVCGLVGEILRSHGWIVSEVHSHSECIGILPQSSWDLVFCDVMLGDADGYSILKHFREKNYEGRFVLMTGQGSAAGALDATAILRRFGNECCRVTNRRGAQGPPPGKHGKCRRSLTPRAPGVSVRRR